MTRIANSMPGRCCKATAANNEPYLKKPDDACELDREADAWLQWGYRRRAELLFCQAQEMEAGR
jgi:hypothetical protein